MIHYILFSTAFATPQTPASNAQIDSHQLTLDLRQLVQFAPQFQVNEHDSSHEKQTLSDTRLRIGYHQDRTDLKISFEGDLTFGKISGDVNGMHERLQSLPNRIGPASGSLADSGGLFTLREANLQGRMGPIGVIAGIKTQQWGLGLISNDGKQRQPFGLSHFGDRVFRLGLKTKAHRVR